MNVVILRSMSTPFACSALDLLSKVKLNQGAPLNSQEVLGKKRIRFSCYALFCHAQIDFEEGREERGWRYEPWSFSLLIDED